MPDTERVTGKYLQQEKEEGDVFSVRHSILNVDIDSWQKKISRTLDR